MNKVCMPIGNSKNIQKVQKEGIMVKGTIIKSHFEPNPRDDEHTIVNIEFSFVINGKIIIKKLTFSINTTHMDYAAIGQLLNVPKLDMDSEQFMDHLAPGCVFDIQVLQKPPYDCLFYFGEELSAVMDYDAMYM